jgi:uncharacterized membrane protein YoaK (UPF0700 family)
VGVPADQQEPQRHALMPALLLLTAVSGVVDAVSFLGLGRVFVANMTGNIVLLGFAFAGASGLSILSSLVALAAFLAGAAIGGRLSSLLDGERRAWLLCAFGLELVLVAVATAIEAAAGEGGNWHYGLIAPLAVGLGIQNQTVRRLGIPDMTTTVLTQTLTGLAGDSPLGGGSNPRWERRLGAVIVMLISAIAGGLLVLHVAMSAALAAAVGLIAAACGLIAGAGVHVGIPRSAR